MFASTVRTYYTLVDTYVGLLKYIVICEHITEKTTRYKRCINNRIINTVSINIHNVFEHVHVQNIIDIFCC